MFGLDPEEIMTGLMKSVASRRKDSAGFINAVMAKMLEVRADRLVFRPASARLVRETVAGVPTEATFDGTKWWLK